MKKFNFLWIPQGFALLSALWFSFFYFQSINFVILVLTILVWIAFFVSLSGKKLVAFLYLGITLGGFLLFFYWWTHFLTECYNAYIHIINLYLIIIAINTFLFIVFSLIQMYRKKGSQEPLKPKRDRRSITCYPILNFIIWLCIALIVALLIWDNVPSRFFPSGILPKQRGVYLEVKFVPTDPARKKDFDENDIDSIYDFMDSIHQIIESRIVEKLKESAIPLEWHHVNKDTRIIAIPGYKNLDLIKKLVTEKTSFEILDEQGKVIVTGKNAVYFRFAHEVMDPQKGTKEWGVKMKWDKEGNQNFLTAFKRKPGQIVRIMTNGKLLTSVKLKKSTTDNPFEYLTMKECSKHGPQYDATYMWGSAQSYQVIFKEARIKVCHVGEERIASVW